MAEETKPEEKKKKVKSKLETAKQEKEEKTEEAKKEEKISKSDKSEGENKSDKSEGNQEWPDIEVGVDVFAPQGTGAGKVEEKKEDKVETLEKLKAKIKDSGKEKAKSDEVPVKEKSDKNFLIPLDDYVKAGIHLGTKAISPDMRKYVYRRRADGLAVLNTNYIDEKLREAIKFVNKFKPDQIVVSCKRDAGKNAVNKFSELTGIRVFTKKYPAGIITNTQLPTFFETDCMFICDPWVDRNAFNDALKVHIPVVSVCDANNLTRNMDCVIVGNNKSAKSLGVIFYILAREYMKAHGIDKKLPSIEEFAGVPMEIEEDRAAEEKTRRIEEASSRIEEKMREIVAKEEAAQEDKKV